jgi:tetratricopeptide (TPR) repeat protein
LLDSFMMDEDTIDQYVGDGPLHTDDRPRMEFFGPGASGTTYPNLLGMRKFRKSVLPYLTNMGGSQDDIKSKLKQYFQATQYTITGQLFYVAGDFENSMRQYQMAAAINPQDDNVEWLTGYTQELMDTTETALLERAGNADAHIKLGTLYQNRNMLDEAIAEFEKAVEIDPGSVVARGSLAVIYESQGKITKAIEEYKEIVKLQPDSAPAHTGLGLLYQQADMIDEAIAEMVTAIQLAPGSAAARINLGIIYQKKGMIDEAIEQFRELVEMQPGSPMIRGMLGDLYREKGDLSQAEAEFEEALKLDPNMGLVHYSLAALYLQQGNKLDEALSSARKAVQLSDQAKFIAMLARVYYERAMYPDAEREIKRAIGMEPRNEGYRELLAEIRKKIGNRE